MILLRITITICEILPLTAASWFCQLKHISVTWNSCKVQQTNVSEKLCRLKDTITLNY